MVCKTPSIALDSEEFKEARDAWLKEKRGERKMKQGDRGCKEWVEMTIADKSARKLLELQESVPEQNTLKQVLRKGRTNHYHRYGDTIPYDPIDGVREWLQQKLIDITDTTRLIGAEFYDANLINDYIKEELLDDLE